MNEEFKKEIINSLKKGGFPTELKVGEILDQRDWFNISNYIYFDKDKNVSREIDFFCVKHSDSNDYLNAKFDTTLIVEVKKSEKPWAFFIQKIKNDFDDDTISHDNFSSVNYQNINRHIWKKIYSSFPSENCDFKSSSYAEVFRENEPSNIYKAIESVTKACYHFRINNDIERGKKKSDDSFAYDLFEAIDLQRPSLINVTIPLIVVDTTLIKAELGDNSELLIEEAPYIPFTSYYISEYNVERSIIVNVVTLHYLSKFLEDLEKWIELKIVELKKIRKK